MIEIGGVSLEKLVGQKVILADVFFANTTKIDLYCRETLKYHIMV